MSGGVSVTETDREAYNGLMGDEFYDDASNGAWHFARYRMASQADLLEAVRIAEQLANIASGWNLDEVEIDGEMRDILDVRDIFLAAIAKAQGGAA